MIAARVPDDAYLVCPLCGFEFRAGDTLCEHGCPFRGRCPLERCPGCGYEFADRPRAATWRGWLTRLVGRGRRPAAPCEGPRSVLDLGRGESARVAAVPAPERRSNTLAVFGLVPGSRLTLVARRPACVVRVGETELALDAEIARDILIEPALAAPPAADVGGSG